MKLSSIIDAVRIRCQSFAGRVAVAIDSKAIIDEQLVQTPVAWVIPNGDSTTEQRSSTDYWQAVTDHFTVMVVLNYPSEPAARIAALEQVYRLRTELWQALLGWQPELADGPIQYSGGGLYQLTANHLYYQFNFTSTLEITELFTRQWDDLQQLKPFEQMMVDVDTEQANSKVEHQIMIPLNLK